MIGPIAAGARAAGAERIAYVMTDGAALPGGSRTSFRACGSRGCWTGS